MAVKFDPLIFRAYDVRGVYGKTIDEGIMKRIGNAFGSDCIVGWDVRNSSVLLAEAFINGITDSGHNAIIVGQTPLAASCFAGWQNKKKTAYITASHLGKEWNGIKFFDEKGIGFLQEKNFEIRDFVAAEQYKNNNKGTIQQISTNQIIDDYIQHIVGKVRPKKTLRVAIDCGNGAAGILAPKMFRNGGFEVESIFEEPDGDFPNREPDPAEDDLIELNAATKRCYMGIAYDGDGDRLVVIDKRGRKLSPEQISFIILSELLKTEKGPVVANVECTRMIDDISKKYGRTAHKIPVGHTFMMQEVHAKKAAFGVERSGHYSMPLLVPFDDSIAISYYVACVLSNQDKSLEQIVDEIPAYPFVRLNFECDDRKKFDAVEKIKGKIKQINNAKINELDGIRADFSDGWILIRASNTGPSIRLTIEADTTETLDRLKKEFSEMLEEEIRNG